MFDKPQNTNDMMKYFNKIQFRNRFLHSIKPIYFELLSFWGRYGPVHFLFNSYRKKSKLHLGCGSTYFDDFLNVDFFSWLPNKKVFQMDFRFSMPFKTSSIQVAFTEHTLEHLLPNDAVMFLSEVLRVLEPGGTVRIVVPDLGKYVSFYEKGSANERFREFENGAEAIWHLTQNNGHLSVWDRDMLRAQMDAVGFEEIVLHDYGVSGHESLAGIDSASRHWESLYLEAKKGKSRD